MKIDYNRVYVKNGNATKAVPVEKLIINGLQLVDVLNELSTLKTAYNELTTELKECHIVKKDTEYIININNKLQRVQDLELYENIKTKLPLEFYKVENGKIVLNKKKVGVL